LSVERRLVVYQFDWSSILHQAAKSAEQFINLRRAD
jgi:hypothetical protein